MHTQIEQAQKGTITPQMQDIARSEGIDPHVLCERIAAGIAVIMRRGNCCTEIGKGFFNYEGDPLSPPKGEAAQRGKPP